MYTLNLMDGTIIPNLKRINSNTFEIEKNDNKIYFLLNDDNLCIAFLTQNDILEDIYVDYALQNWTSQFDGKVRFRINLWDEIYKETNRDRKSKRKMEKENKRKKGEKK